MKNYIVQSDFIYKGFRCVVVFGRFGHRCGYVGIPKNHELYNVDYSYINIDVHGGLTYGSVDKKYPVESDLYWIGFDCGHYYDKPDYDDLLIYFNSEEMQKHVLFQKALDHSHPTGGIVRSKEYVEKECMKIADQL